MNQWKLIWKQFRSQSWLCLIIILIFLGLYFRVVHLANSVYWVDEVATSIRIAGYTKQQVTEQLATGRWLTVEDLQFYQRLSPGKSWSDTLTALTHSPEHTPLYFLLARLWVQGFGSSVTAIRSLSVLLSILTLPCLFWLCLELWQSAAVGWIAAGLMSVSPFFVAYAQEARPYSLWTMILLLSAVALLRSMRLNRCVSWGLYTITLVLGLYTSLLTILVVVGHGIYVLVMERFRLTKRVKNYLISLGCGLMAFGLWGVVIVQHWGALQDNTVWMRVPMNILPMIAIWFYSLAVLFFDVPVSTHSVPILLIELIFSGVVVSFMGIAIYLLCAQTCKRIWLFVLTFCFTTPLALILIDLVLTDQFSTAARYFIPCHLGILLAIAYFLKKQLLKNHISTNNINFLVLSNKQKGWKWMALILISISLFSCLSQLRQPPKYQKSRNLHNQPIAAILNQAIAPVLLADSKQTLDLISLSYVLKSAIKIQILPEPLLLSKLEQLQLEQSQLERSQLEQSQSDHCNPLFLFNPSTLLQTKIREKHHFVLNEVYRPKQLISGEIVLSLWTIKNSNYCSANI